MECLHIQLLDNTTKNFPVSHRESIGKHFSMNSLNIIDLRLLQEYIILSDNCGNRVESVNPLRMEQPGLVSRPVPLRALFHVRTPRSYQLSTRWSSRELVI